MNLGSLEIFGKQSIGLFTVAIFGYFLATFQSTFWLLFDSLAEELTEKEIKNEMKNGYCETPGM